MKRILTVLGLGVLSLGVGACSHGMPSQPYNKDVATPRATTAATAVDAADVHALANVFTAAGDITPTVADYRQALGNLNANTPGSQGAGRREINWDAVPALFTNTNTFPADFFNQPAVGRARGAVFSTPGTGFRVSDDNFADLDPRFGDQFKFFSPIRTFAAVGSSDMTVQFFVPGSNQAATSTGFGVVFSDVDRRGSAAIRLFDADGKNLGRFLAPPAPGGLSFVGVTFPTAVVARVEIESGQAAVAVGAVDVSDRDRGPARDLVIMDDFIYGEPQAITAATGSTSLSASRTAQPAGSVKGAAGQMPAYYDGNLVTINSMQISDTAAERIGSNPSHNQIFVTNDLDDPQDFNPVLDAIQGDGFNPLWEQFRIVFNTGVTPHQFFSDDEVAQAAAGPHPQITLVDTHEVYRCSVVGRK